MAQRIRGATTILRRPGIPQLMALATILLVFSIWAPSYRNIQTYSAILQHSAILGIVACGTTIVLISGGLDLSVGSVMAISTVLVGTVLMNKLPIPLAILAGAAVGALCGLVNGTVIVATGVPAFIATMGMMMIAKGVSLIVGAGKDMSIFPKVFTMLGTGLVWPGILFAVSVLFIFFILSRTRLGFNAYAIGGSAHVSRLSGVKVKRNQIIYYVIGGFLAGLAGVIYTAKFDLATPNTGDGWELQAIAAVIIGGTSLFGGTGGVWRTVLGVLIIKSLETGLIHIGLGSYWQRITIGIVIILAVMPDTLRRKPE
ncbi:MAG: ABC transporter permease [Spirochaetes bacterium]|nr:ABC transporter permease [Spirochaetota bacterium]